jgi:hypothetical protein
VYRRVGFVYNDDNDRSECVYIRVCIVIYINNKYVQDAMNDAMSTLAYLVDIQVDRKITGWRIIKIHDLLYINRIRI